MRELSVIEMSELASAGVTSEELEKAWDMFPNQDFVTAVGAIVMLKHGQGQERNKSFQTQAEADAEVSGLTPSTGTTE